MRFEIIRQLKRMTAAALAFALVLAVTGCAVGGKYWYETKNLDVQVGTEFSGTISTGNVSDSLDADGITTAAVEIPYVLVFSEEKSELDGYYRLVANFGFDISDVDAWLVMPGILDKYTGKIFTFGTSVGENSSSTCIQSFVVGNKTYQALASSYFDQKSGTLIFKVDVPEDYDGLWFFLSNDDVELEEAIVSLRGNNNYFDESPYVGKAGDVLKTYTQYWFCYDREAAKTE